MNKKEIKQSSRYLAVEILEKIELEDAYSNLLLRQVIEDHDLSRVDINLLTELVYGVLQRKMTLDYQLEPFIKKQKKLDNWVRQLLRLSLYQMHYLERIPPHAIVNEAVNIAGVRGHRGISGLVNAVLRNIQRKGVREVEAIEDRKKRFSIQYSLPVWLVEEFIEDLGWEEAEKLAKSLNERPKLSLRVNTNKITRAEAIEVLKKEGYESVKSDISPYGIIVLNGIPADSELFKQGIISVQDESSMLVAPALNILPDHYVLDACAAPGGKTMHIAANFLTEEDNGQVVALDIHQHKMNLIHQNAQRQKVENKVVGIQMDARNILDRFDSNTFDRILIDAPCSGLGLIRRRPEIRYNKTRKDIQNLQKLQIEIINQVSQTLKAGGELIYSTCTLTRTENQEVIEDFLDKNNNFEQLPVEVSTDRLTIQEDGSLIIYPHQYGTDGFFIARFKKAEHKKI